MLFLVMVKEKIRKVGFFFFFFSMLASCMFYNDWELGGWKQLKGRYFFE